MEDPTNPRSAASFTVEWTQSDLPLFHTGLDLDDIPQVADRDGAGHDGDGPGCAPAGIAGSFEILARRLEQLRADVLDPDQVGDGDPRSGFAAAVAAVDALDRLSSMAAALADEAITAAYARSDEHLVDPDAVPGAPRPHLDRDGRLTDSGDCWFDRFALTALGIGPALRIGSERAKSRVWDARQIARLAPHVHARRLAGDWGPWHGHVFVDLLTHLDDAQITAADAAIASVPGWISVRVLRARIERWLRAKGLPRTGAQEQAEAEGHEARRVVLGETDLFGMATLSGYLPALAAAGIDRLLSDLAGTAPEGDPRSLAQRRADAFLAGFTGPAALNPALAEQLGYAPAEVADPRYAGTAADPAQQAVAQEAWQTLRLIGASLGSPSPRCRRWRSTCTSRRPR
ncbi:DUF222 domain-containing protein [Blastococcus sp. Marseille-P5729]|uniref:DUF222 domain-containing protein n=1 Tax=Blastococcus sp. Marseille-P5729 TaxID=2086582 RepID=UPI000D0E3A56|nr:DUF222 domain-containing protein [Blastococcus sp. Marseille-P5729]